MAGAGIKVKTDDVEFDRETQALLDRLTYLEPIHKIMGAVVLASVQRNFEEGGRPAWAPHSKTTEKRRGIGAKILVAQGFAGGLLGSINVVADDQKAVIGTNKIYGAVQQFGARQGAFGRTKRNAPIPWGDIPARPFLVVQPEDRTEMVAEVKEYLTGDAGSQG